MSIEINGAGTITGVDSLSTPAVTNAAGSASSPSITFTGDTNTGLYSPGADQVAVTTGGTARLFVDASGRLLVGTSTSRNDFFNGTTTVAGGIQLELSASDNLNRFMSFTSNNSDTGGPSFLFGKSRGTTANSKTVVQSDDQLAAFNFHGADGSDMVEAARISAHVDGTPGTNDMPGRLVFSTTADGASSPTERMRIRGNGDVCIGKTDRTTTTRGSYFEGGGIGAWVSSQPDFGSSAVFFATSSGNQIGGIAHTTTATAYNTTSDYRLKESVTPVTDGITRLQQLKPSRFNFIADLAKTVDGFLAHEVQDVVPEAITGEKDAVDDEGNPIYQGIDQSKLVPLLTAALQEAVAKIESLEARLTAAGI